MNKEWIRFPKRIVNIKTEVEDKDLLNKWIERSNKALLSNSSEELNKFIDDIYLLRQQSLATDGEFGDGNLVFKEIRANGLLQQIKDKKKDLISRELTVEGVKK